MACQSSPAQCARVAWLALAVAASAGMLLPPASANAQSGTLQGNVRDAMTREPVSDAEVRTGSPSMLAVTGTDGAFQFRDMHAGTVTLQIRHIAYGVHSIAAQVAGTGVTAVDILVSDSAIALLPVNVAALSAEARENRSSGFRRNVVTRQQLLAFRGSNLGFSDVLRQAVPGIRVRSIEGVVGAATCIELRSAATSRNRCLAPAVYVDGVPVTDVSMVYANFPLDMIESIEVVPAAEAGGRFGSGALYGAVLIESRRPGTGVSSTGELARVRTPFYDWTAEDGTHPSLRAYGGAAAGSALGLYAGAVVAGMCLTTRPPSHDRIVSSCAPVTTVGAVTVAVLLPSLGSALGAGIGGASQRSRGRIFPAAAAGAMAVVPGYAMILSGKRLDSDALSAIGKFSLVALTPFMSALADHQFRRTRGPAPEN